MRKNFINFYLEETGNRGILVLLMAVLAGIGQAGLVILIANQISYLLSGQLDNYTAFIFLAVFFVVVFLNSLSQYYGMMISEHIYAKRLINLPRLIMTTDFRTLENIGYDSIYSCISGDIRMLASSAMQVIYTLQTMSLTIFCFFYLYLTNIIPAIFMTIITFFIIHGVKKNKQIMKGQLLDLKNLEDRYFSFVSEGLNGFINFKMNPAASKSFYHHYLYPSLARLKKHKMLVGKNQISNIRLLNLMTMPAVACVVFFFPMWDDTSETTVAALVMIYLLKPVRDLIDSIPYLLDFSISLQRIIHLESKLKENKKPSYNMPSVEFKSLSLTDVYYCYGEEKEKEKENIKFTIGPLNMTIKKGEIIFISGGNGSGKSTLLKLLSGLYLPRKGYVTINDDCYPPCAQNVFFSAIFSDFFLFEKTYNTKNKDYVNELMVKFNLSEKVTLNKDHFSTLNLSSGQKKRLALIVAYAEEKPILIFDEWTADQDPVFREYFYKHFLKDLKKEGRTAIVASHDDRYFHVADKRYHMDYGKLVASYD